MTGRRPYNLGKRAVTVAETRRRVLEAAADLYLTEGFDVSMDAVARRADVAAGTVRYHFPSADDLIGETIREVVLERLEVPTERVLAGATDLHDRILRVAAALFKLYRRTDGLYASVAGAVDRHPALATAMREYQRSMESLVSQALGTHADVEGAGTVVLALVHPLTYRAFSDLGLDGPASAERVAELVTRWVGHPRRRRTSRR